MVTCPSFSTLTLILAFLSRSRRLDSPWGAGSLYTDASRGIVNNELGTGKSRLETAQSPGITFQVTPNIGVDDGIAAARLLLPRCWFDEEKCRTGLEALTVYRQTFNERLQAFTDKPVHDWTSHPADAFRGLAVRHKPPRRERPRRRR